LLKPAVLAVAVLAWSTAVVVGVAWMWRYKSTPGTPGGAPATWPAASALMREPTRPILVMIAHPKCSCTHASLEELSVVMSQFKQQVTAYVLFIKPAGVAPGWEKTYSLTRAHQIPGVTVVIDDDGVEARRFGALVSGQTVLYDEQGRLIFQGGITGSRGHIGDNPGRMRVSSLLASRTSDRPSSAVFGCPLGEAAVAGARP
jgi:hypothetical protein